MINRSTQVRSHVTNHCWKSSTGIEHIWMVAKWSLAVAQSKRGFRLSTVLACTMSPSMKWLPGCTIDLADDPRSVIEYDGSQSSKECKPNQNA